MPPSRAFSIINSIQWGPGKGSTFLQGRYTYVWLPQAQRKGFKERTKGLRLLYSLWLWTARPGKAHQLVPYTIPIHLLGNEIRFCDLFSCHNSKKQRFHLIKIVHQITVYFPDTWDHFDLLEPFFPPQSSFLLDLALRCSPCQRTQMKSFCRP